jgi:hypothetical protein
MKLWRRPTITQMALALLILAVLVWLLERRFPSWGERRKMSQVVSANFDNMDLDLAVQSLIDQSDGSVEITMCTGLAKAKVTLHEKGPISLSRALNEIATQIPTKYYPYGILDVAIAQPVFFCKGGNQPVATVVIIKKRISGP